MDRYLGARWPKGFGPRSLGLALALLVTAGLLSFDPFDPTATNLLSPSTGIRNVLGLPGALIGGTLVEWLGASALLVPLLILNWSLARTGRPRLRGYLFFSAALLLIAAALHGLTEADPRARLLGPGLLGWAGGRWVEASTGAPLGAALLLAGLAFALTRIAYAIDWRARSGEAAALARYLLGGGEARAEQAALGVVRGFFAMAEGIERGISALLGSIAGAGRALRSRGRALLTFAGRTRLPRPRMRPASRRPGSGAALPAGTIAPGRGDAFDAWFSTIPNADAAPAPAPESGAGAAARSAQPAKPSGPAGSQAPSAPEKRRPSGLDLPPVPPEWEKQFRNYTENLDLDWEKRVLKADRARRDLLKFDDNDDDQRESG